MATSIGFHLRPSQAEGRRPGKLYIRIIRARRSRHIPRNYSVYADEWDLQKKRVILPQNGNGDGNGRNAGTHPGNDSDRTAGTNSGNNIGHGRNHDRNQVLSHIDESMKSDLKRLREIVARLEENGEYTASDVVARFTESLGGDTVFGYAEITASRLREQGRERTARAYRSAARSLMNFRQGQEVLLSEIDSPLVTGYERYLLGKGLKMNTVSFYLRNLRALYFRAVNGKVIPQQAANPFAGMHTGVYETKRRALDDKQLKALAALEIPLLKQMDALAKPETADPGSPVGDRKATGDGRAAADGQTAKARTAAENRCKASALHDALLYFLFCYHARGMSFVDMAHLRKENIGAETLTYRRRKTGGMLEVTITGPMRKILSHFARRTEGSEYVFPVIDSRKEFVHRQYETGLKRQNRLLKTLARMAGITENLSTHAARHTWATLAKRMHVPVAMIGEALGHRDVKTTSIYLASFDRATMDELSAKLSEAAKAA